MVPDTPGVVPTSPVTWRSTIDMTGTTRLAWACPLDGRVRPTASTFTGAACLYFCIPVDSAFGAGKNSGAAFADSPPTPEPGPAFRTTGENVSCNHEEHQRCAGSHEHQHENPYQELISQRLLRVVARNPRDGRNGKTCSHKQPRVSRMGWVRTTAHCGCLTIKLSGRPRWPGSRPARPTETTRPLERSARPRCGHCLPRTTTFLARVLKRTPSFCTTVIVT